MMGYRGVENTCDKVCLMISCRWSVAGVWKIYGEDEGMPMKNVRRMDSKSSLIPPSVRTSRMISNARVG
jgi:hypothetical protein